MELPQPSRPFGPEGRKATHDFLSLRTHSPGQHDPRPSSHGGSCLKTHNFLQPLEKDDTSVALKEDHTVDVTVDKPPLQVPPPLLSAEHVLPGGIGTYSISHISYFNQRMPKSEGTVYATPTPAATSSNDRNDENSNCSSYTAGSGGGGGFTLWGESSSAIKGKAQKENMGDINFTKESMLRSGQWPKEMPSESSSNHQNNFTSRSSSQPPAHRSQSFLDMIKSAKGGPPTKEEEDDEYLNAATDGTSHRGELRVKVDGKRNTDQKANTPRSKHSATEQRRRCKINDRFQALREIIPHGDQKRDKASFLLEVIEYIQFLQEKVTRYESPYPPVGWSGSEPPKPTSWRNSSNLAEGFPDQPRSAERPVLTFGTKEENLFLSTTVARKDTDPARADIHSGNTNNNNAVAFNGSMDQRNTLTNKAVAPSVSLVPEVFSSFNNTSSDNGAAMHSAARKIGASDADNKTSLSQLQLWHSRQHQHHQQQQQRTGQSVRTSDNNQQQHQELAVEGGTINISSIYSQGLLNTLTQALQSSGVDLSEASISVQVDVGKRASNGLSAPTADSKDGEVKGNGRALVRERGVESSSGCGDPDQATTKRLKKTGQPH